MRLCSLGGADSGHAWRVFLSIGPSSIWWTLLKHAKLSEEVCHGTTQALHQTIQRRSPLAGQPRGGSFPHVAEDLGLDDPLRRRWRREANQNVSKAFRGQGVVRHEELALLKRELGRVRRERDFLKDAAAYFLPRNRNAGSVDSGHCAAYPSPLMCYVLCVSTSG